MMKYLQIYEKFIEDQKDEILYIFDFDDTIVDSPRFEELAIKYLKEDVTIAGLLDKSVGLIGKSIRDLKIENGRLYIPDPNNEIKLKGNWIRKEASKRVYLIAPNKFYYSELSLPTSPTNLSELYNQVKNKAIVTGRTAQMKSKIEKVLYDFGLDTPNYGLHCYPNFDSVSDKVAVWKGKTIVKILKENNFKKVKFYDDNSKWVNKVVSIVKGELPDVDFEGIKVKALLQAS